MQPVEKAEIAYVHVYGMMVKYPLRQGRSAMGCFIVIGNIVSTESAIVKLGELLDVLARSCMRGKDQSNKV